MLFSRKNIITKGQRPLRAASKVLNASSATAYKYWAHGSNTTSALIQSVKTHGHGLRRAYSTSSPEGGNDLEQLAGKGLPFYRKLMNAWTETPTKWYPLPIAVGAMVLVYVQYRRKRRSKEVQVDENGMEVIKLKGPWQVHVLGALPLRNMSRVWGYVNSVELPVWFRPYGFRLYAFAFGCNLEEIEHADLSHYTSLGDFFYRKLKDGVRPVDKAILVSPADGTVLHFGTIKDLRVEQVKGITYSLDALLGVERPGTPPAVSAVTSHGGMPIVDDHEFANVNGIEYSLDQLIGEPSSSPSSPTSEQPPVPKKFGERIDASVEPESSVQETIAHDASVAIDMGMRPTLERKQSMSGVGAVRPGNELFFAVIYLAPGDYHRFHSPTAWVVEKRRHFPGELFSVSPYIAKRLENLFVLNERVALLGRWKHGFFSMVPVGATNVGSIRVNFDQALRTNTKRRRDTPPGTYTEAVYSAASSVLGGQPLTYAQEMGGFCLGSTIVLVFEAPSDFEFSIKADQKVKVGQKMGDLASASKLKAE